MDFCTTKFFFFSSRRRHTRYWRDWSSDVCSSDLEGNTTIRIKYVATADQADMELFSAFSSKTNLKSSGVSVERLNNLIYRTEANREKIPAQIVGNSAPKKVPMITKEIPYTKPTKTAKHAISLSKAFFPYKTNNTRAGQINAPKN